MKLKRIGITFLISCFLSGLSATEIWISPDGSDRNRGTAEYPLLTLQEALQRAREMRRLEMPGIGNGIHIILKEGTYYLYEPLHLRPEDSGTAESPTTISAEEGAKVTISGGMPVGGWKQSGRYWVADVPDFNGRPLDFRQLWINGRKAVRARDVVDFEDMSRIRRNEVENQILWVPARAVEAVLDAPYAEMVLHQMWCISNLRIKSIEVSGDSAAVRFHDPESRLQFVRPWPSPVTTPGSESPFYLTNAMALLDEPGEWFHDFREQKLYYMPQKNEDINSLHAVVPAIETLVVIAGTLDRPVENIKFRNIQFSHTTWMRPTEKGHVPLQAGMYLTEAYRLNPKMQREGNHDLDNQGWIGRPAAAVTLSGTKNVDFDRCLFTYLASTGLDYRLGNNGGKVEGSLFRDIGGNGILIGSFSPSAHETHYPYNPLDQREVCSNQQIVNNLFEDVTNEDWGCLAIAAGYVNNVLIAHNEIREVSYTGISLGWGWNSNPGVMRDNTVHANHIHHYAKHMYDVAGIYTLGSQPGTVISENYIHDIYSPGYVHIPSHWFYLYTDEGSSFITVKDNRTEGEKFLQNANGPENVWENNGPMVNDSVKANAGPTSPATWIWYPGDYEIWLGNKMNNRRTERGAFFPPFWKIDSHYVVVEFSKELDLPEPEEIEINVEGTYNIKLDGKLQFGMPDKFLLPAGKHQLNIKVWNQSAPPAIFVNGRTIKSDDSWRVTFEDKEWIDESGKASDTSATTYYRAGSGGFHSIDALPSAYRLAVMPLDVQKKELVNGGELYDFGKETIGFLQFEKLSGKGNMQIYYGESREEALDREYCETLDRFFIHDGSVRDESVGLTYSLTDAFTLENSKAFRYVYITKDKGVEYDGVSMLYEYKPEVYRGSFRSSDEELNRIWDVSAYTLQLTTREFFIDGIKRDRWVWSGDAYQSYLMNYYIFFDSQTVKNTIWLLGGKDPVTSHINTIMDYTFYWFLSIYDYYLFSGDKQFIAQIYPRMQSLMEYVLGRTNENGMVEGLAGDWVFVDWADGYMDKQGELSFEQVLFCRSLETMSLCAGLNGNEADQAKYDRLAKELREKLIPAFWNEGRQALVHNRLNNVQQSQITRYANMFAVFYDYLAPAQKQSVKQSVLLNDSIMTITTPYMRFYELEALCELGEHDLVMQEMKDYWGGMIKEGATSFWEKYNPEDKGTAHLAMYGRPYGKSLCHSWGASPIYLLGKYYLGIQPVKAGYSEFSIKPHLGGLKWMEGSVPTPEGEIKIRMDQKRISVTVSAGAGYLYFSSKSTPKTTIGKIEKTDGDGYRIWIEAGGEVVVSYQF